jgi:sec-independent protein translocase protein TatA
VFIRDLLQPWHLLIVLAIILLVFGPGKLSGLGSALGSSIRDFKKATREDDDDAPAGAKTASGNVKSVADDEPIAALPAKSVVIDPKPSASRSVVDLDDDDTMAVPVGNGGMSGSAPIKVGTTRKGYSRR